MFTISPKLLRKSKRGEKDLVWSGIGGGVEKGSSMTKRFALRGDEAVRAYLRFPPHDFQLLEGIPTTVTVDLHKNRLTTGIGKYTED
jgi:hypothetical protein